MSFNVSARMREDMSIKLKTQSFVLNIKKAKEETKKLEEESQKMEMRLTELKMAMIREKEERERKGGGFWASGQTSNGNAQSSAMKDGTTKKIKIKVLKEEPLVVPKRSAAPGTTKHIAQQKVAPKQKIKGPKCGQCDGRGAQVSCMECGEDYCSSCFASFHLKGALRKHRSTPLGVSQVRRSFSPAVPAPLDDVQMQLKFPDSARATPTDIHFDFVSRKTPVERTPRKVTTPKQNNVDKPSLLDGEYDEEAERQEFQKALQAWRNSGEKKTVDPKPTVIHTPKAAKPTKAPVVSADSGTSTTTEEAKTPDVNIKFTNNLTYAERLLLKRGRRSELGEVPLQVAGTQPSTPRDQIYQDDYDEEIARVTLQPTLEKAPVSHYPEPRPASNVTISEIENVPLKKSQQQIEQSSNYTVDEDTEYNVEAPLPTEPPPLTSPSPRPPSKPHRTSQSAKLRHRLGAKSPSNKENEQSSEVQLPVEENIEPLPGTLTKANPFINRTPRPGSRTGSALKSARSESSMAGRPKSRTMSRPMSRTESRLARYGEGLLTKKASSALKEVAAYQPDTPVESYVSSYKSGGLTDFFMAGVKPAEEDRVLTPSGSRTETKFASSDRYKISDKTYLLGPRSWRPDSSLGNTVDQDFAEKHVNDPTTIHSARNFNANDEQDDELQQSARKESNYSSRFELRQENLNHSNNEDRSSSTIGVGTRIVVDGDDMSCYDKDDGNDDQDDADDALDQLEWEMASHDGRVTADGKISRMSALDSELTAEEEELGVVADDGRGTGLTTPGLDEQLDISNHFTSEELKQDFDETDQKLDEEDVEALP